MATGSNALSSTDPHGAQGTVVVPFMLDDDNYEADVQNLKQPR
jgi:hypothetical protein